MTIEIKQVDRDRLKIARQAAADVRPYSHNSALILDGERDGTDIVRAALNATATYEARIAELERERDADRANFRDRLAKHLVDATTAEARLAEAVEALRPFAKVCAAFDYWVPEVLPDFAYPVDGTNLALAREDCPDAIGQLTEDDFRRAVRFIQETERG